MQEGDGEFQVQDVEVGPVVDGEVHGCVHQARSKEVRGVSVRGHGDKGDKHGSRNQTV